MPQVIRHKTREQNQTRHIYKGTGGMGISFICPPFHLCPSSIIRSNHGLVRKYLQGRNPSGTFRGNERACKLYNVTLTPPNALCTHPLFLYNFIIHFFSCSLQICSCGCRPDSLNCLLWVSLIGVPLKDAATDTTVVAYASSIPFLVDQFLALHERKVAIVLLVSHGHEASDNDNPVEVV
jgi:hypothetical protein